MKKTYDAIVIGGGINGGSIAYHLAKRGHHVLVIEKDQLGSKASGAAAGMLAAQAELTEDGPLFQLAKKSRSMFPTMIEELECKSNVHIGYVNKGMLKIAISEEEEQQLKHIIQLQKNIGEQTEYLTSEEVRAYEPSLSPVVRGAMSIPTDGQVSAYDLTIAFFRAARVLGATIKEETNVYSLIIKNNRIQGVVTNEGEFHSERIIVASGAWTDMVVKQTGLSLPSYPVKGECLAVKTDKPLLTQTIFSHHCYLVPKKGGRIIIGATMYPNTFNTTVSTGSVCSLIEKASIILPEIINTQFEKAWSGIRPQTHDGMPLLGEHPHVEGLIIATGHYRNGILLAPITGKVTADLVEGIDLDHELIHHFRIDR
ncbi:glycine oxidase ThiO [Bacillus sp. SCS-151]|uniref:glycine oxidase ThiO n=1 Tax=Nanhaiella sioensis TaxID=3115293 RepID=UPI00397E08E2